MVAGHSHDHHLGLFRHGRIDGDLCSGWLAAGVIGAAALTLAGAAITLPGRRWLDAVVFAAVLAATVTIGLFTTAARRAAALPGRPIDDRAAP